MVSLSPRYCQTRTATTVLHPLTLQHPQALDIFRREDERPQTPCNFAGDYAGGGTMLAMGVLLALLERAQSGCGQVIDAAMVDGANYVALPIFKWLQMGFIPSRADGHVDVAASVLNQGPHFCDTYLCKADAAKPKGTKEYMSVQAIEPHFYKLLLKIIGLGETPGLPKQGDRSGWGWMKERFRGIFLTKTRDEWAQLFYGTDACAVPVLTVIEAAAHPHNVARKSFAPTPGKEGLFEPAPAPKLSRTPGHDPRPNPIPGGHTEAVLREYGVPSETVKGMMKDGIIASGGQGDGAINISPKL